MEYQGKKLFKVTSNQFDFDDCHITVAIDFDFPNVCEIIKEMSCFWGGHPAESAPFGAHLTYFLQTLAHDAVYMSIADRESDYDIQNKFRNREGYYPLDGSAGIALIHTEFPEIDCAEFGIESVKDYDGEFKLEPTRG